MIIIRKKVLLSCVLLFCICYVSYSLIKSNYNDEPVVALPVSEKVIVIDARSWWRRSEEQHLKVGYLKLI